MVWLAVSPRGMSELVVATFLVPFFEANHGDGKYIFWADLAPCHYAADTLDKFDELGVRYVPKMENPPAAPQVRPIEKFCAHLKAKVYHNGWEAKDLNQLENKIRKEL